MTDCADPRWNELLGAYALGACTPDEQQALREHLRGCPACTAELLELGAAREALLTSVPRAAAPPELKSRVMQQVRADAELFAAAKSREGGKAPQPREGRRRERRGRPGWLSRPVPLAIAAACAVVLAVGGALGGALVGGEDGGSSSTRTVAAKVDSAQAPGAEAKLVVSRDGSSRLVVSDMPSPGRGRVYEVWLLSGADAPRPAGALFSVDRAGRGSAAVPGSLDGVDQVLVTSEPAGGSKLPTRTPLVAAQL
jgi:anti-sigma factor RsiW